MTKLITFTLLNWEHDYSVAIAPDAIQAIVQADEFTYIYLDGADGIQVQETFETVMKMLGQHAPGGLAEVMRTEDEMAMGYPRPRS